MGGNARIKEGTGGKVGSYKVSIFACSIFVPIFERKKVKEVLLQKHRDKCILKHCFII